MGHLAGKDIYRQLGRKIDNMPTRAPWNDRLYAVLKELYSADEAEVAVKMPYGLSTLPQILKATGFEPAKLKKILEGLAAKGLVMDLWMNGEYRYLLSPLVIGIFEFTMMRTGDNLNLKEWARLFNEYLHGDDSFYRANMAGGKRVFPLRALPYEEAIDQAEYVEILDYEKASSIVESANKFSIGICSCRHEKLHVGKKTCSIPLDTCSTFGESSDYMVQHGFGKAVSKSEMKENLDRCREMGLVMCADNIKKDISFICFCCGCCCNVLLGISRFGYPNAVVTSTFIAHHTSENCSECGDCASACPINAIKMKTEGGPEVDEKFCIGCGVCGLKCATGSMTLVKRKERVLHPETTFERIILQSLERGTLQNLMFADTQRLTHKFMRGMVGGFLRLPPIKKSLMSETLRSSFLQFMQKGG
ncbi:4Fe-4S ferredoxin iron-sulfur binding domain protein [Candidatus Zixiibacteriota bacterium]|nr:4Fe-4S ferredoxin iron-sulfur binding domain protein [candidate division Zixibacteria bacterium]